MLPNPHRTKKGYAHDVRGNDRKSFVCGFHGWTYILGMQDWGEGGLNKEMTCLSEVNVDTLGGYI